MLLYLIFDWNVSDILGMSSSARSNFDIFSRGLVAFEVTWSASNVSSGADKIMPPGGFSFSRMEAIIIKFVKEKTKIIIFILKLSSPKKNFIFFILIWFLFK